MRLLVGGMSSDATMATRAWPEHNAGDGFATAYREPVSRVVGRHGGDGARPVLRAVPPRGARPNAPAGQRGGGIARVRRASVRARRLRPEVPSGEGLSLRAPQARRLARTSGRSCPVRRSAGLCRSHCTTRRWTASCQSMRGHGATGPRPTPCWRARSSPGPPSPPRAHRLPSGLPVPTSSSSVSGRMVWARTASGGPHSACCHRYSAATRKG
jgi:hypothetical protein